MDQFYTPEEIAIILKTTRKTVYLWMRSGKLKALKAGSLWRIPQSALDEFLTPPGSNDKQQ
jgi:excisionase family DNA binding protein